MARILTFTLSFHWMMFWLLNGLDKLWVGESVGSIIWSGKDRSPQFQQYMEKLGLSENWIPWILNTACFAEIFVAITFLGTLYTIIRYRKVARFMPQESLKLPILLSMVVFTGFSVFDVVVGDRAELLEHGTYMALLGVTWIVASFEAVLDVVAPANSAGLSERRSPSMTDRRGPAETT